LSTTTNRDLPSEMSPSGLMRLYYRVLCWAVGAVLVVHLLLRFLLGTERALHPLLFGLGGVVLILCFLGIELERGPRSHSRPRGNVVLWAVGLLVVIMCFETGGASSPFFLIVVATVIFAALTQRPSSAFFLTACLAVAYALLAWVVGSESLLRISLPQIRSTFMGGREMGADEATALATQCAFLFGGAWMATRVAWGYRQRVTRLEQHATRDPLTGLPNRRAFVEKVRQEIDRAQQYRWPISILIIDLDHFKRVNDQHGHAFGDAVLAEASKLLRETVGTIDHLARIGGEEFAVAAVAADPNHGSELAADIVRRFRTHDWAHLKADLHVSCSVGVAVLHPGTTAYDPETALGFLLAQADRALYKVKETGRNNWLVSGQSPVTPSSSSHGLVARKEMRV
jgi:diguanylate cyclase (GGDEF)-like protein